MHARRKYYRKSHNKKSKKQLQRKRYNHTRKNKHTQRGGFNTCSLATVQEPGFTIPAIGDVPGFSLSQSKSAIHRSNCKADSYHAMT